MKIQEQGARGCQLLQLIIKNLNYRIIKYLNNEDSRTRGMWVAVIPIGYQELKLSNNKISEQ
jgi:hypothetical protein